MDHLHTLAEDRLAGRHIAVAGVAGIVAVEEDRHTAAGEGTVPAEGEEGRPNETSRQRTSLV